MKKIRFVFIVIGVFLLTACKAEETLYIEKATGENIVLENTISPDLQEEKQDVSYGLFDYVVTIDQQSYTLPIKVSELMSSGWSFTAQSNVASEDSVEVELVNGTRKVFCTLTNYEREEVPSNACYITGLLVSKENSGEDIAFYQGMKIGASFDDMTGKAKDYFYRIIWGGSGIDGIEIVDDLYYEEGFGYQLFFENNAVESIRVTYCPDEFNRKKKSDMIIGKDELPVHELTTQVCENMQPDVLYSCDFNKDGAEDTMVVKYETMESEGRLIPVTLLAVNDRVTLIDVDGDLEAASSIIREDGTSAAIFTFYKVDDYTPCCIYQIFDDRCIKTCEIRGNMVAGSLTKNQCSLTAFENVVASGWSSQTDYEITEDFELKRVGNSKIVDQINRGGLTVKKELPVMFDDGTEGVIEPGTRMSFYETDYTTVLKFETNDGRRGTIYLKTEQGDLDEYKFSLTHMNGIELVDYFDEEELIYAG